MRDSFHQDAEVNISWFQGSGYEFVEASRDMAARGMLAKHRLGPVLVTLNGDRALATLSAIIDIPTEIQGKSFTLSAHCLLIYRVSKRKGVWRLSSFEVIYRRDEFTSEILGQTVQLRPEELAVIATPTAICVTACGL